MHSGYGEWFESQSMDVRRDTGMPGIFWDSYQNLGVTCIDWRAPDKAPQAEKIWNMQAKLQRLGYKQRCEVVTIFGVSQVAIFGFENDKFRRRLWSDTVRNDDIFALIDTSPAYFTDSYPYIPGKCGPQQYFWMVGHRVLPILNSFPWKNLLRREDSVPELPGGELASEYGRVNHLYRAALPYMHRLRVQPGGAWALWLDEQDQPAIAWVFRDTTIPFQGVVCNLETSDELTANHHIALTGGNVYRLTASVHSSGSFTQSANGSCSPREAASVPSGL
jgi:hypothetical protein